ncbi:Bug family tripartite tricarboxylate transporter substrate binding protein [Polaromonas sp.]|uniref:Bug family tripartite tricarboxylate transporter substrate binding protein n=1 Tax=Polaromonas sp. TaxID=1869339 RepID=UPI003BAA7A11
MKLVIASLIAACSLTAISASAQSPYPTEKPITIIVPFAAGSGTDVLARALIVGMTQNLKGASFIIDNRPGANGIIAAGLAAKAAPDGYTLFLTTNTTHSVNPVIYKKLPYDPNTDFVPVGLLGETAPALLTSANNPVSSIKEMVEISKKKPGGLNFATANTSSLAATQLFKLKTGGNFVVANYKSAPQALTDLTGGTIDYFFGDLASGGALVRGGKLKALAVVSDKRLPGFPMVPTMADAGYPGVEIAIWIGLFAPKGTSPEIVEGMNKALLATQRRPEFVKALNDAAVNVRATSTDVFSAYVAAQYWNWNKLAKQINLQAE